MLSYRFEKIRVYKFPEELFSQFRQIVLFAVCKNTPFPDERTCEYLAHPFHRCTSQICLDIWP
jgi:hypothetical protein